MRQDWTGILGIVIAVTILAGGLGVGDGRPATTPLSAPAPAASDLSASGPLPTVSTNYTVTFDEVGLTLPTLWTIAFAGQVKSTSGSGLQFQVPNGTNAFDVTGGGSTFTPSPSSGSIVVNGSDIAYNITWSRLYNLLFTQSGLPNNSPWFVFIQLLNKNAYTPANITYRMPNGSYNFTAGSSLPYTPNPKLGVLVVRGADIRTSITFTPVPRYTMTFSEAGLPAGFPWYVSFGGGMNLSANAGTLQNISFTVTNGTFAWTAGSTTSYAARPSSGATVISGANASILLQFGLPPKFPLTFTQQGLPVGASWSVNLDGATTGQGLGGADIVFMAANGSHAYTVATNSGLTPSPARGFEGIAGKPATVPVAFSPPARSNFTIVFDEQGLPSGPWWVRVGPINVSGPAGAGLLFPGMTNGSYGFVVGNVDMWAPAPPSGTVSVTGSDIEVRILFSTNSTGPGTSSPGLSKSLDFTALSEVLAATAVLATVGVALLLWRRRREPPIGTAPPASSLPPAAPTG